MRRQKQSLQVVFDKFLGMEGIERMERLPEISGRRSILDVREIIISVIVAFVSPLARRASLATWKWLSYRSRRSGKKRHRARP